MVRTQNTEWPACRKHEANQNGNVVKPGGLWHYENQQQMIKQAQQVLKRKDQFKEFAKIFWVVLLGVSVFVGLLLIVL